MNLIRLKFNFRLFAYLAVGFVLCTAIGTVSHEGGHYIVSKSLGFSPVLHYDSVSYGENPEYNAMVSFYEKHKKKILSVNDSPEKTKFKYLYEQQRKILYLATLAGPVQTMLTGTIGLVFLWLRRKKLKNRFVLKFTDWLLVLITFFWSRQPAILLQKIYYNVKYAKPTARGDEENIARYLHVSEWSVIAIWGILGIIPLVWITFYVVPLKQRLTFIIAGLIGSVAGIILWLGMIGKVILP